MPRKNMTHFFAIPTVAFDNMYATVAIDILRYEGASPLSNAPDGWLAFQKRMDRPVTRDRLASFGIRRVEECRADVEEARGSCPAELRWKIEDAEKAASMAGAR